MSSSSPAGHYTRSKARSQAAAELPEAGPSLSAAEPAASENILRWKANSCESWTNTSEFKTLSQVAIPFHLLEELEASFQQDFADACKKLAVDGHDFTNSVRAFRMYQLDRVHAEGTWKTSAPYQLYKDRLYNPSGNVSTTETSSSRVLGPVKPDLMIVARAGGMSHIVWTCEIKFLDYRNYGKPAQWVKRHSHGLSQAIWYLYCANTLCGASLGLSLINSRFQRLVAINGENGGPDVLVVEVAADCGRDELLEGLNGYVFGKEAIPNDFSSSSVTERHTSTLRLYEHLTSALKEAEERVVRGLACGQAANSHNKVPEPNIRLRSCAETIKDVLSRTETFEKAQNAQEDTGAGPGAGGSGGGPGTGEPGGGAGPGAAGRRGGQPEPGKQGDGGEGEEAVQNPTIELSLGRTPQHAAGHYVQDWVNDQAAVKPEPILETFPDVEDDKLCHEPGGDTEGTIPVVDIDWSSDDGENDTPLLTMDEIIKHMHEHGWMFRLASPQEMDGVMNGLSASRCQAALNSPV